MTHQVALLPGNRLHLQHGPIDLVCQAWGTPAAVRTAYHAAAALFPGILPALCAERDHLSRPHPTPEPEGPVARTMHRASSPLPLREAPGMRRCAEPAFLTPMAAVAGAVADHVLHAMTTAAPLEKAFVNNGGDIAFHLTPGHTLRCGLVARLAAPSLDGTFLLAAGNPARGLATSGRATKGQGGRSLSRGIADAVTVLARTAAAADAAATVVANAVDLPGHPAVTRVPATAIDPDSDLGTIPVTWQLAPLTGAEAARALDAGLCMARNLQAAGLILHATLALQGQLVTTLPPSLPSRLARAVAA